MPGSGSGSGVPVTGGVPGSVFPSTFRRPLTYVTLEEYARWLAIAESAIFGVTRADDPEFGCDDYIWNESTRRQLLSAIDHAEKTAEVYLGHYLLPKYVCQEYYRWTGCEFQVRRRRVIALGDKVEEVVATGVATGVATLAEEYTLSVTVDFDSCDQIVVYYPGQTRYEIHPSNVYITGTTAQITIPRPRLLKAELFIDYKDLGSRPEFDNPANFLETVDVYRRFPDAAQAVTFLWKRRTCGCEIFPCAHTSTNPGEVITQSGAGTIVDARLGNVRVEPATFNTQTGVFDAATWTEGRQPDGVLISYVSGINQDCTGQCPEDVDPQIVRAVIALAHSDMPLGLCTCGPAKMYYESDAYSPKPDEGPTILTPFGTTRGQNLAWQIVKRNAIGRGGILG